MKHLTLTGLFALYMCTFLNAQTPEELYQKRDFQGLIEFEKEADKLSEVELYYIGYAFFQLENDKKAIRMYDKAIEKGLDDDYIFLYKGLSLRYDGQFEKALENFKLAVKRSPTSQKNLTELGNCFYLQSQYDSALVYFYKARELDFEHGDPYLKIPNIYHIQENFEKALEEYHLSAKLINKNDPIYLELLKSIGQLEYTVFRNYANSVDAYEKLISLAPTNYDLYPKLIKAYYANENYDKGDSLIDIMKVQYEKKKLSDQYQKYGSVSIAEFDWKGQKVSVYKYFNEPKEPLDEMFKIYLLGKDGKSVERTLMTEKTMRLGNSSIKHVLCEREKNGGHRTYPFGWSTDKIDFPSLKKAVLTVLEEETKPSASSGFEGNKKKK